MCTTSSRKMNHSSMIRSKRSRIDRSARRIGLLVGLVGLMGTLGWPGLTRAQVGSGEDIPDFQVRQTREFELSTGFEHRFETDIDDGGEVQESRFPIRLGYNADLSPQWHLGLRLTYVYNRFDFSGTTGFGGLDPWENIHLFDIILPVTYRLSSTWRIVAAPMISIHAESGADVSQGIKGGGFVAAVYQFSPRFSLGLVVRAQSQIEDDADFFILPLVYWQISSQLSLTTQDDPLRGGYGAELTCRWGGGWRVGLGWGLQSNRFRLDDSGMAPDGVGEASSTPLWASIAYVLDDRLTFEFYVGGVYGGELKLENENGDPIREEDVDRATALGLVLTGTF
ncbi:MAG: hypothetical protein OEU26_03160 [Candidatus Tectomicrobia bacterium]|nr:hypothetical protein [Candidatus Tectomicrobia bacterium]